MRIDNDKREKKRGQGKEKDVIKERRKGMKKWNESRNKKDRKRREGRRGRRGKEKEKM